MSRSSKSSSKGRQSPAKSPFEQIARDPKALQQTHAAVHRFVDRLEVEVQAAVDAARSRRLAPSRLAECVAELEKAICAVQPYEKKRFERKPIVIGSPREEADIRKRLRAEARLVAEEGPKEVELAVLECVATDLVNLFRGLAARLAVRVGGTAPRRKAAGMKRRACSHRPSAPSVGGSRQTKCSAGSRRETCLP